MPKDYLTQCINIKHALQCKYFLKVNESGQKWETSMLPRSVWKEGKVVFWFLV
jgi:hypothetical protein